MANTFLVGDKVKTAPGAKTARLNGKVRYIACQLATNAGGKTCDRKTCAHTIKDYIWILWPGIMATMSYHYSELEYEVGHAAPSPTTLPAAKDMPAKPPSTDKEKDMASFKKKVSDILKPEKQNTIMDDAFWQRYNGFTGSKFRRGHVVEDATARKPLQESELDWDVYRGIKKGPLKKQNIG